MNASVQELLSFSAKPSDYGLFERWVGLGDVESFLRQSVTCNEIVLQALSGHTFFHTVVIPRERLQLFSPTDRLNWEVHTDACWGVEMRFSSPPSMWVAEPIEDGGSPFYAKAEQIVFSRIFEGRMGDKHYYELLQKFSQIADIHYLEERNAWCRLDKNGDIEDVVRITNIPGKGDDFSSDFVTVKRTVLDDYLVVTGAVAVRVFDITRVDSNFGMWREGENSENLASPDIVYRSHIERGHASYMRGSQIISPLSSAEEVFDRISPFSDKGKKYESFIVLDWRHGGLANVSCAPGSTANYFVKSDLPFEVSPAFFKPEVLAKYKGDSDKYRVEDRSITCRGAWHLKGIDVNEAGQIHAYIVDLRNLPYEEQLHWKAYNEPPKGGISKRAYDADMLGCWTSHPNPLLNLKNLLREWHSKQIGWWVLRSEKLWDSVNYPVTTAADEWANDLMQLDKLVIEGFSSKWLRSVLEELGVGPVSNPGSLNLLKQCLTGLGLEDVDVDALLEPLRTLQNHRSKLKGHVEGADALSLKRDALKNFGTYRSHFSSLCEKCRESLATIGEALSKRPRPII